MAKPVDFALVELAAQDELDARLRMAEMLGRDWETKRGPTTWAGFAAERALIRAWSGRYRSTLEESPALEADLILRSPQHNAEYKIEVKTRAVQTGWVKPARFEYVVVPSHEGRAPIKPGVDQVWFCWYSANANGFYVDAPWHRRLWLLGYVMGLAEFERRAVYYRENEPLPRGGFAGVGGAYVIEVKQLRPFPRGLFREVDKQ